MASVLLSQPEMTILDILKVIKWQSMWVKNKASVEVTVVSQTSMSKCPRVQQTQTCLQPATKNGLASVANFSQFFITDSIQAQG